MNVSACRFGSPAFLSLPHFLHGDPQLRELVNGMQPDPEAHSFYFAVEPVSIETLKVYSPYRFVVLFSSCKINPKVVLKRSLLATRPPIVSP